MATSTPAASVTHLHSAIVAEQAAGNPAPATAAPTLSLAPVDAPTALQQALATGRAGQHKPSAASAPALATGSTDGRLRPAAPLPTEAREHEDDGDPDSDSGEGQQLAHAGLGAQTAAEEEGSADSSMGEPDSDTEESGSADSGRDKPDREADEHSATTIGKSTAEQGNATTADDGEGDSDSDAEIEALLVNLKPGSEAIHAQSTPSAFGDSVTSAAFTGVTQIPASQIAVGAFLANGAFGKVYRGAWGTSDVALKKIDFDHARQRLELSEEEVNEALEWEVARLATTHHPNLVQFHGVCHKEGAPYLVMEFCPNGTLQNALLKGSEDGGPVPASRLWQWMLEISQALAYLHDQGMLHRDLKAENVLIDQFGRAKLADLGVAQVDALLAESEARAVNQGLQDMHFIAPENVGGERNRFSSKATDIYALGLVFWQMVSRGDKPTTWEQVYQDDPNFSAIKAGIRIPIPDGCPAPFRQLILACWRARPAERADIAEVLRQLQEMASQMHRACAGGPHHAPGAGPASPARGYAALRAQPGHAAAH